MGGVYREDCGCEYSQDYHTCRLVTPCAAHGSQRRVDWRKLTPELEAKIAEAQMPFIKLFNGVKE